MTSDRFQGLLKESYKILCSTFANKVQNAANQRKMGSETIKRLWS